MFTQPTPGYACQAGRGRCKDGPWEQTGRCRAESSHDKQGPHQDRQRQPPGLADHCIAAARG